MLTSITTQHACLAAYVKSWGYALELRDVETNDHSQRVTRMAIQLSQSIGLHQNELITMQRGALLHDIGKIGIPDRILLKAGPLTEAEWAIMRQHPVYAFQMLTQIPFLNSAIDVPYCHHERWDGTGYPRGLRGTNIPLSARIFAVVDVWDALSSNRPYRPAWPRKKICDYLHEQAGKLFDPEIVGLFLKLHARC